MIEKRDIQLVLIIVVALAVLILTREVLVGLAIDFLLIASGIVLVASGASVAARAEDKDAAYGGLFFVFLGAILAMLSLIGR
jgi:hypothetical protein